MRRTKEDSLATREQVLDAAERVFRERGVGHASLAEVADAAGVTRGAIYHHFSSKADLFEAMLARAEMPLDAAFDAARAQGRDPLTTMRETTIGALRYLASSQRVRNVFEVAFLRCEYTDELASVEKRHLRERAECLNFGVALLEQAVAHGDLPPDTDVRLAAQMFYAYVNGLMRDWVQAPDDFDLNAAAPQLIDVFLAGLRAVPPRKQSK